MLFEECFGDRLQCTFLVIAYYQAQKKHKQSEMKILLDEIASTQPVTLHGDDFDSVLVQIDNAFENAMHNCFQFGNLQ